MSAEPVRPGRSCPAAYRYDNGAAGMANSSGTSFGPITRISADPHRPSQSLYGIQLEHVRFDALPVHYDHAGFMRSFSTPGRRARPHITLIPSASRADRISR